MSNIERIQAEAQAFYDETWQQWYEKHQRCTKAALNVVIDGEGAAYFSPGQNLIYIPLCEGDVDEYANSIDMENFEEFKADTVWKTWKQCLVHEMLHEYQHKAVKSSSQVGRNLMESDRHPPPGPGHDDNYYTAVAEKASYFNMSPEDFLAKL